MSAVLDMRNVDCMEMMAEFPDGYFDLAVVDPPYFKEYGKSIYPGSEISTTGIKRNRFASKEWKVPDEAYFKELKRVSENQIVWGCNYYAEHLPVGRIVWDKKNDFSTFSKAELASHSFGLRVDLFRYEWNGMLQGDRANKERRIHPTQKPVKLYDWIFAKYAKPGMRVLDTHLGSGSSAIAAFYAGLDFTGSELDSEYFSMMHNRVGIETRQEVLAI